MSQSASRTRVFYFYPPQFGPLTLPLPQKTKQKRNMCKEYDRQQSSQLQGESQQQGWSLILSQFFFFVSVHRKKKKFDVTREQLTLSCPIFPTQHLDLLWKHHDAHKQDRFIIHVKNPDMCSLASGSPSLSTTKNNKVTQVGTILSFIQGFFYVIESQRFFLTHLSHHVKTEPHTHIVSRGSGHSSTVFPFQPQSNCSPKINKSAALKRLRILQRHVFEGKRDAVANAPCNSLRNKQKTTKQTRKWKIYKK